MHPDSVKRMEAGLEPLRLADKEWVARTARYNKKNTKIWNNFQMHFLFSLYKAARRKVFALIEKERNKKFHIRHLWAFGSNDLVRPLNNMGRLILKEISSPMDQMWAYCTWKAILGIQMDMASDLKNKFVHGIEVIIIYIEQFHLAVLFDVEGGC